MKVHEFKITITRKGYVKNDDEIAKMCDEVEALTEHYLNMMTHDLKEAGYEVIVK
jgi:hypothetical protein